MNMSRLLLEATNITLRYGTRTVLDIARFRLYDGERVGLVGENGAGKSTFLKALCGQILPETGSVRGFSEISLITQLGDTDADDADMNEKLKSEFSAREKRAGLSGGERTRRRIAGALSRKAGVLLADEPTVDLDEDGIRALEKHLLSYEGAVILVSHDRALLQKVCTRVCEITDGHLTDFPGDYASYRAERARRLQFARDEYSAYRAEEARIRRMIQRETEFASQKQHLPSRMGNSEARLHKREVTNVQGKLHQARKAFESRLDRLEVKERPREDVSIKMELGASGGITSRTAFSADRLYVKAGDALLLKNAAFTVPTGTRTALIGPNGCGKTTLLRHIVAGGAGVRVSPGVRIGYFGQDHAEVLDLNRTVLENALELSVFPESDVRTVLARLNIRAENVFKPAGVLSGGERAKTALARLLVSDANALILDEPTNHLDVESMEALENVLREYAGTLIFVSHDRAFVSAAATRLMFIRAGRVEEFEGTLSAYEQETARRARGRDEEALNIRVTSLEMRLAALSDRLSAPKKGDKPELLNEEYLRLAQELKDLRAGKA